MEGWQKCRKAGGQASKRTKEQESGRQGGKRARAQEGKIANKQNKQRAGRQDGKRASGRSGPGKSAYATARRWRAGRSWSPRRWRPTHPCSRPWPLLLTSDRPPREAARQQRLRRYRAEASPCSVPRLRPQATQLQLGAPGVGKRARALRPCPAWPTPPARCGR